MTDSAPRTRTTDTRALLRAAAALAPRAGAERGELETFSGLYLDWILTQRGMTRRTADRRERTSLMLRCLVATRTLGEALPIYLRFAPLLWGGEWLSGMREAGERVELAFGLVVRPDLAGLVNELWTLARCLSELEWLTGGVLGEVAGQVRSPMLFEAQTASLLFGHPLAFGAAELRLSIPKASLARRIVARAEDIEAFCVSLPMSTLTHGAAPRGELKALMADLIRRDRLGGAPERLTLKGAAAQLAQSPATLSRRLRAEGTGFREISEAVLEDLARDWLASGALSIEAIAARLGYSDAFAFRRWFRRRAGCAPSAFRRAADQRR